MPDILKPAYNFGGVSLSQMLKPYVDNWLRTRQAVSDLLYAFTVFVLSTDLTAQLAGEGSLFGGGTNETQRAQAFVMTRDNLGLMMVDKTAEEFQNVSAPLGGLDHLQAQAQEHMAAVAAIPIVKLFGITPSGLMATADGEIRTFYDTVNARQKKVLGPVLETVIKLIQLDAFGGWDPRITHEWIPLYQLDAAGEASVRKTDADTDAVLIQAAVISPEESRTRLAADPTSPYAGLEGPPPEPPAQPPEGGTSSDPSERVDNAGEEGSKSGANAADEAPPFSFDSEFSEAEHPRGQPGNAGQFGPGGGRKGEKDFSAAASNNDGKFGSGGGGHVTTKVVGLIERKAGASVPPHVAALKIPPAWTNVRYSEDPKAALQAVGRDAKGREQRIYSTEFSKTNAEAKFRRIQELDQKFQDVLQQNEEARKSGDPKVRAVADAARLVMTMGIRPGSETDTQAKVKAYGATTLEGRHVVETDDGVRLRFTGKKGVVLDLPVYDKETARMLLERKTNTGESGKLFGVSDKTLLDHVHSFDGGGFKTKDFRTLLGTTTALEEVSKMAIPSDEKSYRKAVMDVAKKVSAKLGNTPTVTLQSYIAPEVFSRWQA